MRPSEYISIPLISLFVYLFAAPVTIFIAKLLKRFFPVKKEDVEEWVKISEDKETLKKLDRYSAAAIFILVVLWGLLILGGILLLHRNMPQGMLLRGASLLTASVLFVTFLLSSMGFACYVSSWVMIFFARVFSPKLSLGLLMEYYPGAFNGMYGLNVSSVAGKSGANLFRINIFLMNMGALTFVLLVGSVFLYSILVK